MGRGPHHHLTLRPGGPRHLPRPPSHGPTLRRPRPAQPASPTWTCSSVKMVCSCIWGTGVLVVTDISRICLKICKRWEVVARDLLLTQGQTPDHCYSVFSVNRMYQLPLGAS